MIIKIFKKEIELSQKIIKLYETFVTPFSISTAEYLAITNGCTEESTSDELQNGILEGIADEIETYLTLPWLLSQPRSCL